MRQSLFDLRFRCSWRPPSLAKGPKASNKQPHVSSLQPRHEWPMVSTLQCCGCRRQRSGVAIELVKWMAFLGKTASHRKSLMISKYFRCTWSIHMIKTNTLKLNLEQSRMISWIQHPASQYAHKSIQKYTKDIQRHTKRSRLIWSDKSGESSWNHYLGLTVYITCPNMSQSLRRPWFHVPRGTSGPWVRNPTRECGKVHPHPIQTMNTNQVIWNRSEGSQIVYKASINTHCLNIFQ